MKIRARYAHLIESVLDKVIGYVINVFAVLVIFNGIFGYNIALSDNLMAGVLMFFVAVARSYFIRRYFNKWIGRMYEHR